MSHAHIKKNPMENIKDIWIFKTNIRTEADKEMIRQLLDNHASIDKWTVDSEDSDCVLRIVTGDLHATDIIHMVTHSGFHCAELD